MSTYSNRYGDSPELRIGMGMAPTIRYLYGYMGLIQRAHQDKISNARNIQFLRTTGLVLWGFPL